MVTTAMTIDTRRNESAHVKKLAHDIRNALSSLYTYAQILESSPAALEITQQKKIGSAMAESVRDIEKLLAEHLDESSASTDALT